MTFNQELRKQRKAKVDLRKANLSAADSGARLTPAELKKLDSTIKKVKRRCYCVNTGKNTAFIKKLRNLSEENRDQLVRELKCLNLSRYVSEAVSAICEAKLKYTGLNAAVEVCFLKVDENPTRLH